MEEDYDYDDDLSLAEAIRQSQQTVEREAPPLGVVSPPHDPTSHPVTEDVKRRTIKQDSYFSDEDASD